MYRKHQSKSLTLVRSGSLCTNLLLTTCSQSDTPIIQKLFSHFKRVAATHKLGVLYVIDSITRQWIEKARQSGQELAGIASPDGTYASGVYKMTESMPSLMDDIIRTAPQDQKVSLTERLLLLRPPSVSHAWLLSVST